MQRKIIVLPYDPRWPAAFAAEAEHIRTALGAVAIDIHHIGSTSVPGLAAKPLIDILLAASSLDELDSFDGALVELGYEPMGEFGIPGRRFYRKGGNENRSHHIHAFQACSSVGDAALMRHLAFRDYLSANSTIAKEYGALKKQLAAAHPDNIEDYMNGKHAFIQEHQAKALQSPLND